ncbi:DUF3168 domain-containing protein [Croceicoccus sp. YJ47]|uniref:tail completion protein gp17 n=1 Tax=Croceicoccus sp. YJ47 TaxID=2798724 RepID=UPI0019248BA0|nr:DUF3168 domain-containing protein [Croceicoccus sp. YJ47]QQN73952.1 DUF3168 domain-containing protein [Croceicoccus sp. YJ47]
MEAALRARLLADAGLSALVQKISWLVRAQSSALPAITLQKVTLDRGYTYDGASGFRGETVQFDIWSNDDEMLLQIRGALTAALEKSAVAGGVTFSPSFLNSERQTVEDVAGVGAVFRISLDAIVWWQPS